MEPFATAQKTIRSIDKGKAVLEWISKRQTRESIYCTTPHGTKDSTLQLDNMIVSHYLKVNPDVMFATTALTTMKKRYQLIKQIPQERVT
jgi:hypothetical protein